jgi:ribonuclease BN (tRNA processing enzyme)
LIYISDNEPFQHDKNTEIEKIKSINKEKIEEVFESYVENKNQNLIKFCENADLLIHDTQYLAEEYKDKITWGHSPVNFTVELAMRSKVKQLILFHHDPDHDDAAIDRIEQLSKKILRSYKSRIACRAAQEGMVIEI